MKNKWLIVFSTVLALLGIFSNSEFNFKIIVAVVYVINLLYYISQLKKKE